MPRLWTLWELMKVFNVRGIAVVLNDLIEWGGTLHQVRRKHHHDQTFPLTLPEDKLEQLKDIFETAEKLAAEAGFGSAKTKAALINIHLKRHLKQCDAGSLSADVRNLYDMFMADLWKCAVVQVAVRYADYVNNDRLFGDTVSNAFPHAQEDIKEAGNCLAVDCGTAAVFHLMRAVEWGLRAFCAHLHVRGIPRKRKGGRSHLVPIEWSQWEQLLEAAQQKVDDKIGSMAPGPRKQHAQEFYYPLLREMRAFKDEFRNHVMHTRRSYTQSQAAGTCDHVRRFMELLSTQVTG